MSTLIFDFMLTHRTLATSNPFPTCKSRVGRYLLVWSASCDQIAGSYSRMLSYVLPVTAIAGGMATLDSPVQMCAAIVAFLGVVMCLVGLPEFIARRMLSPVVAAVGRALAARAEKQSAGIPPVGVGRSTGARVARV